LLNDYLYCFLDACGADVTGYSEVLPLIESTSLVVFVSSTQGNGELPSASQKFFSYLFDENGHVLVDKNSAVLGFGSSAYPIFCGAAALLSNMLAKKGANEIVTRGECDAMKGEESTFYDWARALVSKMASMPAATQLVKELANKIHESTASSQAQKNYMTNAVIVKVFTAEEVKDAAAASFMKRTESSTSLTSFVTMKRTASSNSLSTLQNIKRTEEDEARHGELIKIITKSSHH
jgi:sulfite reductase alpha subunit-like flavoprotein